VLSQGVFSGVSRTGVAYSSFQDLSWTKEEWREGKRRGGDDRRREGKERRDEKEEEK